jgi:hypothetical protein
MKLITTAYKTKSLFGASFFYFKHQGIEYLSFEKTGKTIVNNSTHTAEIIKESGGIECKIKVINGKIIEL